MRLEQAGPAASWPILGLLTLLLAGVAFVSRPLFPVDETRYLSVAWEMWTRGDFLVPHLNGEPYSDKPPLLFWLFQLGWAVFGVNEWWPRLVAPLFGFASLPLTAALARRLWPDDPRAAALAPWWLFGCALWLFFLTPTLFDMALAFFVLLGIHGIVTAAVGRSRAGWAMLGAAIGLGVLTKGPVVLLHTLPAALLAPWWLRRPGVRWGRWYLGLAGAAGLGAALALAWAIPAGRSAGDAYAHAIFWTQTADRVVSSFAHARPWWWYGALLPVFLLPWSLWPRTWRAFARLPARLTDGGVRLCLVWAGVGLVGLSLVSGKQPHYLLPLLPAAALLTARLSSSPMPSSDRRDALPIVVFFALLGIAALAAAWRPDVLRLPIARGALPAVTGVAWLVAGIAAIAWPPAPDRTSRVRTLALAMAAAFLLAQWGLVRAMAPAYDLRELARHLARLEAAGIPLAAVGKYHGQFQFLGRLTRPLEPVSREELPAWFGAHPEGRAVLHVSGRAAADHPPGRSVCDTTALRGTIERSQPLGLGALCLVAASHGERRAAQ